MDSEPITHTEKQGPGQSLLLSRQAVFSPTLEVWGYELDYVQDQCERNGYLGCVKVLAGVVSALGETSCKNSRIMVGFSPRCLREGLPLLLPPEATIVRLDQKPSLSTLDYLTELHKLRAQGFSLALTYEAQSDILLKVLPLLDILSVELAAADGGDLLHLMDQVRGSGVQLLAKGLENDEQFQSAKQLGFDLFQGDFFKKPEVVSGRRFSSAQQARFQILKAAGSDVPNTEELAEAIECDVTISYRLLAYLNSAAFSLPCQVRSVRHAVMLLGWNQVRRWVRLIILTDFGAEGSTPELAVLCAHRARFLETAARELPDSGAEPDRLFIVGLFSLLEAMLQSPLAEILEDVALDSQTKSALLDADHPLQRWLRMAEYFEQADWDKLGVAVEQLGLDPMKTASCYYDALIWTNEFFAVTG